MHDVQIRVDGGSSFIIQLACCADCGHQPDTELLHFGRLLTRRDAAALQTSNHCVDRGSQRRCDGVKQPPGRVSWCCCAACWWKTAVMRRHLNAMLVQPCGYPVQRMSAREAHLRARRSHSAPDTGESSSCRRLLQPGHDTLDSTSHVACTVRRHSNQPSYQFSDCCCIAFCSLIQFNELNCLYQRTSSRACSPIFASLKGEAISDCAQG
uniref:Uncharacterized protein n=1 Tax=Hyaloperonospora arabidopsidis (strain Emoy2) TaxID=559515 RepID=M4BNN9_HYAAE